MSAEHVELPITGMTCASCATRVERKLNKLEGVTASVNYATEKATVEFDPGAVAPEQLVAAVEAAGYQAGLPQEEPEDDATAPLRQRLLVSALLTLPVLLLAMIPPLQFDNWQWLTLTLAAPVVVWGALPFHRAAWLNLRHATATMDTLVSLGVIAAFGWSLYALFLGDAGEPGLRMAFDLVPDSAGGTARAVPRGRLRGHGVHARGPVLRGARQAPRRRCAHRAAGARRAGRVRARRGRPRAAPADRRARRR